MFFDRLDHFTCLPYNALLYLMRIKTMQITLNGKSHELQQNISVAELIKFLNIKGPYAVEINRQVCPKAQHPQTKLNPQRRCGIGNNCGRRIIY